MEQLQETVKYINSKINNFSPKIAVILGSGLGCFCDNEMYSNGISLKYCDIPNFESSNVAGHKGELLFCELNSLPIIVMQGRFHYYEGNSIQKCAYPIKVFKKLGIETLIVTNAAGAAHKDLNIGDIVLINDHINFMGANPLIGKNDDSLGERFPDMSNCYTEKLREITLQIAKKLNINIKQGIYFATSGPSYETAAEVRAFRTLGADVIGMSTVPEIIMANYLKMNTLAFSLVTNHCTGVSNKPLSHNEVIETGKTAGQTLSYLIKNIIKEL